MSIIRGRRQPAEAERADGASDGILSRRNVLGGLATLPVLYGFTSAAAALAGTAPPPGSVSTGSFSKATDDLVRGAERRYNAPLLTAGTRLVLPAGIKAVPVQNYYRQPHLASGESAWPRVTATDGSTVDASIVPERGAATRIAMLSGFREGWYELIHAGGRADRVTWDAGTFSYLFLYGEFGATNEAPFNRFYSLALQPFSRNPYSRNTPGK